MEGGSDQGSDREFLGFLIERRKGQVGIPNVDKARTAEHIYFLLKASRRQSAAFGESGVGSRH